MTDTSSTPVEEIPRQHRPGSARAALAVRDFRYMWYGSFLSNVGTWMQNVVLPAYIYHRTGKASLVALLIFAQLGPLLVLSIPAGVIADRFDRRTWLISMQSMQLLFSALLAVLALGTPSLLMLFCAALGVGVGNALNAPAWSAVLPSMVRHEDIAGAISLNSTVINGSRVIGPIIVAVLSQWGVSTAQFFFMNSATYLFVIGALLSVHIPTITKDPTQGWRRFTRGIEIARQRKVIRRLLLTLASFSLLSLPYVGLFPAVARLNFGIDESGVLYKWLYATWGFGACLGGLAIGTVCVGLDKRFLIRFGFLGIAFSMLAFGLSRSVLPAFIFGFVLGFFYFFTTTSMMTVVQSRLEPEIRGRIMALWFMAFGGTVPLGNLLFGPLIDEHGSQWLLFMGAAWAGILAWWCNIAGLDDREKLLSTHKAIHEPL
ncbi:MAG: MFS transporter [Ilumatobacteraceae bacterium]